MKLKQLELTEPLEHSASISFDNDAGDISEIGNYPLTNKYYENIFSLTDLYLYRGVTSFYL